MTDTEHLYKKSAEFKDYVDKYSKTHNITVETAMTHKIVKNVADQISEKEKRHAIC